MSDRPLLAVERIEKRFPGVVALAGVDLELRGGEVHALVGENGAGKSTLIRILTGATAPDAGEIRLDGVPVRFACPRDAKRAGIGAVHQELTRIPDLSVAENMHLGRPCLDRHGGRERARAALARVGLDLDVDAPLGSFPPAVQQMAAIARALDLDARALVLDEPTASLDRREAGRLLDLVRDLRARGLAVVFVGHRLEEIFGVADRITVLRNGKKVGTFDARATTRLALVEAMLGRAPLERGARARHSSTSPTSGEVLLEARRVAGRGLDEPFDLELRAGEILGLAGLLGSGRSEVLRLLSGAERRRGGCVRARDSELPPGDVRAAVDAGVVLSPEERGSEGIFPGLSVRENVAIAAHRRFARTSAARQRALASELAQRLRVACSDLEQEAGTLSGGNQQKVLFARFLAAAPEVLLLDEPTRGIDVGAKAEIEDLVRELASKGLAAVFVSSALEEMLEVCDRALALHGRRVVASLGGAELTGEALLAAISAGDEEALP